MTNWQLPDICLMTEDFQLFSLMPETVHYSLNFPKHTTSIHFTEYMISDLRAFSLKVSNFEMSEFTKLSFSSVIGAI